MRLYLFAGIAAVALIAVSCIAYVIFSSPTGFAVNGRLQEQGALAAEDEYPISGGQQIRPRF